MDKYPSGSTMYKAIYLNTELWSNRQPKPKTKAGVAGAGMYDRYN